MVTLEVDLAGVGIFAPDIDLASPSSLHHYDRHWGGVDLPSYYIIRAHHHYSISKVSQLSTRK